MATDLRQLPVNYWACDNRHDSNNKRSTGSNTRDNQYNRHDENNGANDKEVNNYLRQQPATGNADTHSPSRQRQPCFMTFASRHKFVDQFSINMFIVVVSSNVLSPSRLSTVAPWAYCLAPAASWGASWTGRLAVATANFAVPTASASAACSALTALERTARLAASAAAARSAAMAFGLPCSRGRGLR